MPPKRLTYDFIKSEFIKRGYTLLSQSYNYRVKLEYKCNRCGHLGGVSWGNFQQGGNCPICVNRNIKPTLEKVKASFEKEGYTLLSKEYINHKIKLDYVCPNGHRHSMNWLHWSSKTQPRRCPTCALIRRVFNNPFYKGGVKRLNLPLYATYHPQLEIYERTYKITSSGIDLLGVHCTYCDRIYIPKATDVYNRMQTINGRYGGQNHFYCSQSCKIACPIFNKREYPEGYALATSREMQPTFRKMVLERDSWTCQKCGNSKELNPEEELHAHHIISVVDNPIESCDIDNGITLCKECHKLIHSTAGCRYNDLRCKK